MNNPMEIWDAVRSCPPEALKTIGGGKLRGMSDINPIWRYRKLTELFGPAGLGWRVGDVKYELLPGANGDVAVMCTLTLLWRFKDGEEWNAVPGQGGSMFVTTEKGQLVTNDEAWKMAYTDAVSVACKQLGVAADVYWDKGSDSKYQTDDDPLGTGGMEKRLPARGRAVCEVCGATMTPAQQALSKKKFDGRLLCPACQVREGGNA